MNRSSLDLLLLGTLFIVPFISLLVGRLQSLAADFVGSSVSLIITFVDAADKFLDGKSPNQLAVDYAENFLYIFLLTLFAAALCIWLNKLSQLERKAKNIEDGAWGGAWPEFVYWTAVAASMALLLFSFSVNLNYEIIFGVQVNKEATLFALFDEMFEGKGNTSTVLWAMALALLFCTIAKYVPIIYDNFRRKSYAAKVVIESEGKNAVKT